MSVFTFLITAEQPLLLTSLQGDPNSSVSFGYIPGSSIRGALIGRYQEGQRQRGNIFDPNIEQAQRLFFTTETRYLNAYIYPDGARRMLPCPRSWRHEKYASADQRDRFFDFSFADHADLEHSVAPEHEFCWIGQRGEVELLSPHRHVNIHNTRDRPHGRGTVDAGTVFRYEAIAPRQTFQAVIVCDAPPGDDLYTAINDLLVPGTLWLGGSRSAGYGRVAVHGVRRLETWHEVGSSTADRLRSGSGVVRVTLLSDLIVRDVNGQYNTTAAPTLLAEQLGVNDIRLEPKLSFLERAAHGGFNRTWGLPLPQTPALAAGSVFVFSYTGTLDVARVAALEARGFGERRVEGYGRLAVSWRPQGAMFVAQAFDRDETVVSERVALSAASRTIADRMGTRLLRARMEQRLIELVDRYTIEPGASSTQLSRLRIVARRALNDSDTAVLQALLENLPQNARAQFEQAKVRNMADGTQLALYDWLKNQLMRPTDLWIDHVDPVALLPFAESYQVNSALASEYTLRLIMALARQAVKEAD